MAEKMPIEGISKSECAALTSFFDRNNNDDKASLKRQKSPEATIDTGCECVLLILRVNCSYFEIFIVVNRPYFVPRTIPYRMFKFTTVPLVT